MQMQDLDDIELLREYVAGDSEAAFATLVARHLNKVYSVAWRHTGNAHAAEEITQAVFVILATKARRLSRRVILSGWLYETARLTSLTYIRSEIRRTRREEAHMQSILNESESEVWPQIAPMLDAAMAGLNETDRHAVVLRFFDGKSMKEVGDALGANENAAKKRVSRAVEKLRKFFTKRGVVSTATIIAGAMAANSVQAAPATLAQTVTAVALAKGAAASASTLILVKGASDAMVWAKAKLGLVIGMGVLVAAAATTIIVKKNQKHAQAAYEYEADGIFEGEQHLLLGDVKKWNPVSFKIYVRNGQWLIYIPHPWGGAKYLEIGFDGKTMYHSGVLEKNAIPRTDLSALPGLWDGSVSFDSVPFAGPEPHFPIIWLALASSRYLDDANDRLMPPYSTEVLRVRLPASVMRMDNPPRLPQTITFFNDGFDRREGVPKKIHPPYDKGFTNAIYTVNTFTNIGGYSLPLTFNLKVFVHTYSGSGITLSDEYNGTITNISAECPLTNFIPEVISEGRIRDTRFVSADAIRESPFYYKTNRWLNTNEVEGLPGFSNYTVMERLMKNTSPVLVTHEKLSPITLTPVQKQELGDLQKLANQERRKQIVMALAEKRNRNYVMYAILGFCLSLVLLFLWRRTK